MILKKLVAALLMPLALMALPGAAQAQKFPPMTGRVVDAANLLSPEQEAQLTQLSEGIEQASSRQFVVATIPDLQDYPIEDYGYKLGRAWGIGQAGANNGIVLIVAPKERKVRIEVGNGLEPVMTDALASTIIRDTILPRFRDGDMPGGIIAGANEIGEQMKLPLEAAEARAKAKLDAAGGTKRKSSKGDKVVKVGIGMFWTFIVLIIVISSIAGGRRGRRYRRGSGVAPIILWSMLDAASRSSHHGGSGWGGGGGGGWGGGGGGGFSGGGGSFGGGGASGGW